MPNHVRRAALALAVVLPGCAGQPAATRYADPATTPPPIRIDFRPDSAVFAGAVGEYERIWRAEGPRIVAAMENASRLRFANDAYADTAIVARVLEAPSNSGYRNRPMRLRASYPRDTKVATLIHELGHRLQSHLFRQDEEEHGYLFLWLYDVWSDLYGPEWADAQVAVEKRRGQRYVDTWDWALSFTREERAARWRELVAERTGP